jgi:AcrR family transcriptional regulator
MRADIMQRRSQVQRREEAESRLLDAAIALIAEKGHEGLTLAEVGVRAGYSRGLPVHYFETRDRLVAAVVDRLIQRSLDTLRDQQAEGRLVGLDLIEDHYVVQAQRLGEAGEESRALYALYLASLFNSDLAILLAGYHRTVMDLTARSLEEGRAAGQIRADVDVRQEAEMLLAYRRGAALLSLSDPGFDITDSLRRFFHHLRARLSA